MSSLSLRHMTHMCAKVWEWDVLCQPCRGKLISQLRSNTTFNYLFVSSDTGSRKKGSFLPDIEVLLLPLRPSNWAENKSDSSQRKLENKVRYQVTHFFVTREQFFEPPISSFVLWNDVRKPSFRIDWVFLWKMWRRNFPFSGNIWNDYTSVKWLIQDASLVWGVESIDSCSSLVVVNAFNSCFRFSFWWKLEACLNGI